MTRDFADAWRHAEAIPGWLTREQAETLFSAAASVQPPAWIVEIGSHHGKSTVVLAAAKQSRVRLLAVDPFDDRRWGGGVEAYDELRSNLAAASADRVEIYRGTSASAVADWRGDPIGLVYVDGAHDRTSVLTDIDGWAPFVVLDGRILVHDAFSARGVTFALLERFLLSRTFLYAGSKGTLVSFVRRPPSTSIAARNVGRMTPRLAYFARNTAIKVGLRQGWARPVRILGHRGADHPF